MRFRCVGSTWLFLLRIRFQIRFNVWNWNTLSELSDGVWSSVCFLILLINGRVQVLSEKECGEGVIGRRFRERRNCCSSYVARLVGGNEVFAVKGGGEWQVECQEKTAWCGWYIRVNLSRYVYVQQWVTCCREGVKLQTGKRIIHTVLSYRSGSPLLLCNVPGAIMRPAK